MIIPIKLIIKIDNINLEYNYNLYIPDKQEKEILDCVIIDKNNEEEGEKWLNSKLKMIV